jgi:hypothetical protein
MPQKIYPQIGLPSLDTQIRFLESIQSSQELPKQDGFYAAELPFEQGKVLYRAIQSHVVACSITQSKLQITTLLLKLSQSQPGELIEKLKQDRDNLSKFATERRC